MKDAKEAKMTISGVELSSGQSMTVRVALQSFFSSLQEADALGADEHGRAMGAAYKARVREINVLIAKSSS